MARLPRLFSAILATGLVISACSDSGTDQIRFSAEDVEPVLIPNTLVGVPDAELSGDDQRMVRVHSVWLCELQEQTFANPGEIPAALEVHLASFQVDPADYAEFSASLPGRKDLRDATLFAVQQTCFSR